MNEFNEAIREILGTGLSDKVKLRLVDVLINESDDAPVQDKALPGVNTWSWVPTYVLREFEYELRASKLYGTASTLKALITQHAEILPNKPK